MVTINHKLPPPTGKLTATRKAALAACAGPRAVPDPEPVGSDPGVASARLDRYARLVDEMRAAQRLYFACRTQDGLVRAKIVEAQVDFVTAEILVRQRSLFPKV